MNSTAQPQSSTHNGWIGVDLDGTLAYFDHWRGVEHIGAPLLPMIDRVKRWLAEGKEVKIFTARLSEPDKEAVCRIVKAWCKEHIGQELEVTNVKDYRMYQLWDDRAVMVVRNNGEAIAPQCSGMEPYTCGENPEKLRGAPIGMYHCPECGLMVLAGLPHPEAVKLEDGSFDYADDLTEAKLIGQPRL